MLLRLILENYIPLLSSGIKTIEIDLKERINLIIGTNGSGKSSIMRELNPHPADNANFKNGRKYVLLTYNNIYFELDSYTHKGTGHSFKMGYNLKEMHELNPGGTFTVQKDLVKQHFGLDNNLIKSLTGIRLLDRFSTISLGRRKDLLLDIYPNNTSYALSVYNKLRTERNELRAVIKNQVTRFAEENKKLEYINDIGIEELENRARGLETEIKEALLLQGSLADVKEHKSLHEIGEFNNLVKELLDVRILTHLSKSEMLKRKDEFNELLLKANNNLTSLNATISNEASNLAGYEELLEDGNAYAIQIEQLNEEINRTTIGRQVLDEKLKDFKVFNSTKDFGELHKHVDDLVDRINNVTIASNPKLTLKDYNDLNSEHDALITTVRELKTRKEDLEHRLKHIENKEDINCPKCSNVFKAGVSEELLPELTTSLKKVTVKYESLRDRLIKIKEQLENDNEWFVTFSSLIRYAKGLNNRVVLELLKEYEIGKVPGSTLVNALTIYKDVFNIRNNYELLTKEIDLIKTRNERFNDNTLLKDSIDFIKYLEGEVIKTQETIRGYKTQIDYYDDLITTANDYENKLKLLATTKERIYNNLVNNSKLKYKQLMEAVITDLTTAKESYLANIIKNKSLVAVIDNIETELNKLKFKLNVVETLLDGLCPNKGLIGRLMGEFLNNLVGNINYHLDNIWDGALYLKPCTKDNGDLTYKFPLITGDYNPTPDISDGSLGQCDMIDFLFRLVILEYIDYPFPLMVDEPGVNLDSINRANFFSWLKDYLGTVSNRQVFIVSHFLNNQKEFFNDPNVIVIRRGDLEVPFDNVNKNVKITMVGADDI